MIDKIFLFLLVLIFLVCACDNSTAPDTSKETEVILNKIFIAADFGLINGYSFVTLNTDGSNLEFFGEGILDVRGIDFSSDKSFFCFLSMDDNWSQNEDGSFGFPIYTCTLEDKQIESIGINATINDLKLSNNDSQIAYFTSLNKSLSGFYKLFISNIDGSNIDSLYNTSGSFNSGVGVYGWGENDNSVIYIIYHAIEFEPVFPTPFYYEIPVDGKSPPEEILNPGPIMLEETVYLDDFARVDGPVTVDSINISYTDGNYPDYYYQAKFYEIGVYPFTGYVICIFSYDLKNKKEYLIADSLIPSSQLGTQLIYSPDRSQIVFKSENGLEISDYTGENRKVILSSEIIPDFHESSIYYTIKWL